MKGYRAVRQVQVTLRQLDKLNALLDGALKAGLNEIRAVELGVAQPGVYREQAGQQAASLLKGFNAKLWPVYSNRYHVVNDQPMPMIRMYKADEGSDVAHTYEQQSIHFDHQAVVVFKLQRNAAAQ